MRADKILNNSKRIKGLRRDLVKSIPRFPNNKESLLALESKTLIDLLITYIGWRMRFVAARPRKVKGLSILEADPRTIALRRNIDELIEDVESGKDLTPRLSYRVLKKGYTPSVEIKPSGADNWADKDFLLNVMGLHHFHLGPASNVAKRTDEVLFASVTRDEFEIMGLFDHDVFADGGKMTPERERLWNMYEARSMARMLPGQTFIEVYSDLSITLSGHPIVVTRTAQHHFRKILEIEPKLDDPDYLKTIYQEGVLPAKSKLRWHYQDLDFGLLDESAGFFGVLHRGPN